MFGIGGYSPYSPIYNPYSSPFGMGMGMGMGMGCATPMLQPHETEAESPTTFGGRSKSDTTAKIFGIGALAIAIGAIITHGRMKVNSKEIEAGTKKGFWARRADRRAANKILKAENKAKQEALRLEEQKAKAEANALKKQKEAEEKLALEKARAEYKANRRPLLYRLFGIGKTANVDPSNIETKTKATFDVNKGTQSAAEKIKESVKADVKSDAKAKPKVDNTVKKESFIRRLYNRILGKRTTTIEKPKVSKLEPEVPKDVKVEEKQKVGINKDANDYMEPWYGPQEIPKNAINNVKAETDYMEPWYKPQEIPRNAINNQLKTVQNKVAEKAKVSEPINKEPEKVGFRKRLHNFFINNFSNLFNANKKISEQSKKIN